VTLKPQVTQSLKIAIFGGGGIARKAYLPLLLTWPGIQVVGLFSRTQRTVDEVMAGWPVGFGTTRPEALLERQPEAAFVLTDNASHYDLSRQLLEAGVDVYVEKPATESSALTIQLADLAKGCRCVFMVGFNRRYALLYRQAKEIFGSRRIQLCNLEKHRPSAYHVDLFNNYLDDTIHQIDLLRYFCGEVRPVHTSYEMRDGKLLGALSITETNQGGIAVVMTSLAAGAWQERLTIHGEGMTVEVSAFRELRVKYPMREEVFGLERPGLWVPELTERGFSGAIEHFFECVRQRQTPLTDGYEAARTQQLVEDMVAIAKENR
jgi:virulence factor